MMAEYATATSGRGVDLKPGQLWRWNFAVGDGTWFFQKVTSDARFQFMNGTYVALNNHDTFTVVALDDPGPYEMRFPGLNDLGQIVSEPPKRWHVVLCQFGLVWVEHQQFSFAELLGDA